MPNWTKEQLEAIKKRGKNIIVSAGAGSGKTAVLTERVIEKLKSGVKINELLILTFTNAAAKEMKERIRGKIKELPELQDNLNLLESAYITTFDSYTLSLVKKYSDILNVSSNLEIILDSIINPLKEDFMEEVFKELYIEDDPDFKNFLDLFTVKNDTNIQKYLLKIYDKLALISNLDEYLDHYLENFLSKEKIEEYLKEYEGSLKEAINEIEDNLIFITDAYPDYGHLLENALDKLMTSSCYDEIKKEVNVVIPRRPNNSEDIKEYKDQIDNIIKNLKKELRFKDRREIEESLELTKEYIKVIIKIIRRFKNKLDTYKKENDLYEFNDVSLMAIKLLKENPSILEEVKNSFAEICIDEYQDTNDIQEEFISLIRNNNVYMVGDIKQSIYGFRNANPSIFKAKYDLYKENKEGLKIDLLANFRSRKEVVKAINTIFSLIMDDDIGGASYKESHLMHFGNQMYEEKKASDNELAILRYENKEGFRNNEIEAFIIARDILSKVNNHYQVIDKKEQTLRDARYDDFCIIMDRGVDFPLYKKIFEYLNIPLTIYEDSILTKDIDVKLLNNLIGLILLIKEENFNINFKYYFMSVGRSYLFTYNDNYLFEIMKSSSFKETTLYTKALNIAQKIDFLTSYDLLKLILKDFQVYEKMIMVGKIKERTERIDNLLIMAKTLSNMGYTPHMFHEFMEKTMKSNYEIKYPEEKENANSVKIMNIHKSKGLEFSICYYSGFYKTFNIDEVKEKFTFTKKYGFIVPFFKEGVDDTILASLNKRDYLKESISEKIRLLYVALTRAKEKMIIVAPIDVKDKVINGVSYNVKIKYNSFLSIMNSIAKNLEEYITFVDINNLGLTKEYLFTKNLSLKIKKDERKIAYQEIEEEKEILKEERASKKEIKVKDLKERKALEYGLYLHQVLEMSDFLKIKEDSPVYDAVKTLIKELNITSKTKIYKEQEFIYEKEGISYHGIIDLLLESEKEIKIVDYKLKNTTDEAYLKQLKVYYDYLKEITKKDIKVYLFSILNKELEEVDLKVKS